jgi:hypothetical protein
MSPFVFGYFSAAAISFWLFPDSSLAEFIATLVVGGLLGMACARLAKDAYGLD